MSKRVKVVKKVPISKKDSPIRFILDVELSLGVGETVSADKSWSVKGTDKWDRADILYFGAPAPMKVQLLGVVVRKGKDGKPDLVQHSVKLTDVDKADILTEVA